MREGKAGVDPFCYCPQGKSRSPSGPRVGVSTRRAESLRGGRLGFPGPA